MRIELAFVLAGYLFAGYQPMIAEVTGSMEPLPWWGQLGVCGMIGFLHWWCIGRTIPAMNEANERGMKSVAEANERGMSALAIEIKGMRDDYNKASERQIDILSQLSKE